MHGCVDNRSPETSDDQTSSVAVHEREKEEKNAVEGRQYARKLCPPHTMIPNVEQVSPLDGYGIVRFPTEVIGLLIACGRIRQAVLCQ